MLAYGFTHPVKTGQPHFWLLAVSFWLLASCLGKMDYKGTESKVPVGVAKVIPEKVNTST
jgi:hypothetical protein